MATLEQLLGGDHPAHDGVRAYHKVLTRKQVLKADKLRDKMHDDLDGRYKMWVRKTNDEEELADGERCVVCCVCVYRCCQCVLQAAARCCALLRVAARCCALLRVAARSDCTSLRGAARCCCCYAARALGWTPLRAGTGCCVHHPGVDRRVAYLCVAASRVPALQVSVQHTRDHADEHR